MKCNFTLSSSIGNRQDCMLLDFRIKYQLYVLM